MVKFENKDEYKYIWISFVALVLTRLLYIVNIGIAPDEAYYWDWTRFLSFGYYDHPPMVAWLTHVTTTIFGDTIPGIKIVCFVGHSITALCTLLLAKKYCSHHSSFLLLIVLFWFTVIFGIGTLVLSPDIPQYVFWSAGMLAGYYAFFESSRKAWILLGIIAGLGLLSKYIFILFFLSIALFILIDRERRPFLKRPYPYLALGISIVFFLPNIFWNLKSGWPSLLFQMKHGLGSKAVGLKFDYIGEYILGQIGVITPFLFIILIIAIVLVLRKYRHDARLIYLLTFTVLPIAAFALSSLRKRCEANWPAPAYISGFILIAWLWDKAIVESRKKLLYLIIFSTGISVILCMLIYAHIYHPFLPIPPRLDMTKQIRGWKRLANDVQKIREEIDPQLTLPVCTNRYQETSLLAFYMPGQPRTFSLNLGRRSNHYSLLNNKDVLYKGKLIFVQKLKKGALPLKLSKHFKTVEQISIIYLNRYSSVITYGIFLISLKDNVRL